MNIYEHLVTRAVSLLQGNPDGGSSARLNLTAQSLKNYTLSNETQ
jgi:hypothetical protein